MEWQWLQSGISPLGDLIKFLNRESRTNDVLKKQFLRELRDNLNIFQNGFRNKVSEDMLIDMLSNEALRNCIKANYNFKKLKKGKISAADVKDDRNKRYIGWTADKLVDRIDEKIEELKNIKKMNGGSVARAVNNTQAMLANLYYRMKLLGEALNTKK